MAEEAPGAAVAAGTVPASDGALIYYEDRGEGIPLLLVPCWMGTARFWDRQAEALGRRRRVIAMDPRGHGNSSKVSHGHTVPRYARDVREVIEALGLSKVVLVGWSFAGSVVLEYWMRYGADRVRGLGLVDIAPFPFSPESWNGHGLRNYGYDRMNALLVSLQENRKEATEALAAGLGIRPEDREWAMREMAKTPLGAAASIYSDYVMRDYSGILPTVAVPTIVWAADSPSRKGGIAMGRHIASRIPGARFVPFESGGHFLNHNEPDRFNESLAGFLEALP